MGEADKPFACTNKGCQMTFTNEDHLNVHKKKHDMVLNLGLTYKNTGTTDQTPTPTRFIRNCEEVGLFQDLQNVNPFEETFRKAIEYSKDGILHIPDTLNDDSLHTPQILHHISEINDKCHELSHFNESSDMDDDLLHIDVDDPVKDEDDHLSQVESSSNSTSNVQVDYDLSTSTSNDIVGDDLLIVRRNFNNCLLKGKKSGTKLNVKARIKQVLHNKRKADVKPLDLKIKEDNSTSVAAAKKARPRLNLKSKLNVAQTLEIEMSKLDNYQNINLYDKNLNGNEKRKAMNRMAQVRSRKRKKMWVDQMEEAIAKLRADNKAILNDNQKLKEENAFLKLMLLKHVNCQLSNSETQNGNCATVAQVVLNANNNVPPTQTKPTQTKRIQPKPAALVNPSPIQPLQRIQSNLEINQPAPSVTLARAVQIGQNSVSKLLPKTWPDNIIILQQHHHHHHHTHPQQQQQQQ